MDLSSLASLGKVAGVGGIAIGAVVLLVRPLIDKAGKAKPEQLALFRLIAIGAFAIGVLGIVAWAMGTGGGSTHVDVAPCAMRRGRWARRPGQHGQLRHGTKSTEGNPVIALRLALVFRAILVLAHPHLAAALGDTDVKAGACSIATGGNATKNTITCNFGLTPEQLREATKAAVAGATEPLLDRIDKIRSVLGVTRSAAEKLLKIAGEQPDVPDEKLAEVLTSVAADYQRLKAQAAALNPDNPTARALVAQAKAAIEAGQLAQAHELLRQATQVQIAAAQEARKLREQAQEAEDAELLGAAASTATEGDLAMTERHYPQAADLFKQAAELVPAGHRDETTGYLERQADALYREGDERGDNAALKQSIEASHLVLQQ